MDENAVAAFLDDNEEFLDRYVTEHVNLDVLEKWTIRKINKLNNESERKSSLSRWKFCVHADKRKMLENMTEALKEHASQEQVVMELGRCISSAVNADGFKVYRVNISNPDTIEIYIHNEENNEVTTEEIEESTVPAVAHVTNSGVALRLSKALDFEKFPNGHVCSEDDAEHVLYQPLIQPNGETVAVLEMWRLKESFHEEDEEITSSYLVWGGIALHYAHMYLNMNIQRKLADFLLAVVKSIFQDMVSIESLVTKVMNFAQKLVDADRASLFLVDNQRKELYATVFDLGHNGHEDESGDESESSENPPVSKFAAGKEIRIPLGSGIAGHVAETGEILNIQNAYEDTRFNSEIDLLTGYKTKTILCMPIYIRNAIIGVVQMVNKRSGLFTKDDEVAFEMFAVYCGLALHHAKLYDKIRRSEQKYKVALEVLSYHNTCTEEEVENALRDVVPENVLGIDDFYFSPFIIDDYEKATHAIYMFTDLFGLNSFDVTALVKFVLTVRKNYRRVPYHNWTHGFSVANSMYNVIKKSSIFNRNEKLALFIGALCHDLDHRGKNNKFMLDTASPLAAMYSTSTMEHHHFNQTITILQQDGHNIFSKLSSADYKHVLGLVKHCILATDLAVFFPNKARLSQLITDDKFEWTISEHRSLALAISMTAADLSASAKPWDIQVETVRVIFQEFYEQGDAERAAGREPIPMMDRYRPEQQASSQVGFLLGICVPCYSLLNSLIPETEALLSMCQKNLERWRRIEKEVAKAMKKKDNTLPEHLYIRTEKKQSYNERQLHLKD